MKMGLNGALVIVVVVVAVSMVLIRVVGCLG